MMINTARKILHRLQTRIQDFVTENNLPEETVKKALMNRPDGTVEVVKLFLRRAASEINNYPNPTSSFHVFSILQELESCNSLGYLCRVSKFLRDNNVKDEKVADEFHGCSKLLQTEIMIEGDLESNGPLTEPSEYLKGRIERGVKHNNEKEKTPKHSWTPGKRQAPLL